MAAGANSDVREVKSILSKLEESIIIACNQISGDTPTLDANAFRKEKFWENFIASTKLMSHEATKLCMMFSSSYPSKEECQALSNKIESTCFAFIAVYFTLPKSKGKLLHHEICNYVLSILQGMKELCAAARNRSSSQLQNVGNVWEKCEAVENLPRDNRDAVVTLCREEHDVVHDASQELMDALENDDDDSADEFFVPRINGMNVPQSTWTDSDRQILLPCSGLIRAAKACLKKTLAAITERGDGNDGRCISELDEVADVVKTFSAMVDDFVLCLYPPVNHSAVKDQAATVRNTSKSLLSLVKTCHFCSNADEEWVTFLERAVDHNWLKINDLVLAD